MVCLVEQDVAAWKKELIKTKKTKWLRKKPKIFEDFLKKL
jgi:hypothetical protein